MRATVDTNVLLSGLLWRGTPHVLVNLIRGGRLGLVSSAQLLSELEQIITRQKFQAALIRNGINSDAAVNEIRRLAVFFEVPPLSQRFSRDPDDDAVLALAVAAQADIIISGDADLLILGGHAGIPILSPAQALARIDPALP